jgi:hypothetical protein
MSKNTPSSGTILLTDEEIWRIIESHHVGADPEWSLVVLAREIEKRAVVKERARCSAIANRVAMETEGFPLEQGVWKTVALEISTEHDAFPDKVLDPPEVVNVIITRESEGRRLKQLGEIFEAEKRALG